MKLLVRFKGESKADEVAEQIERARETEYFSDSIEVKEYQLYEGTYFPV